MILTDNGYYDCSSVDKKYYFYIKDHLGNNRAVADAGGSLIQSNQYYPFGLSYGDDIGGDRQPYKYNGKELDSDHGLNMYDYSARYYEPAVGRFTTVDPLAEKYYSISPYVYVMNNPIKYVDLRGDSVTLAGDESKRAFKELSKSVKSELKLKMNKSGNVTYRIKDKNTTLSNDAQMLVNAIDDKSINVTVTATDNLTSSVSGSILAGEFQGSVLYLVTGKVEASQEINAKVLQRLDNANNANGISTLHEVLESYKGAQINQQERIGVVGVGTPADSQNMNSVYRRSHLAVPMHSPITGVVYTANPPLPGQTIYNPSTQGYIYTTRGVKVQTFPNKMK